MFVTVRGWVCLLDLSWRQKTKKSQNLRKEEWTTAAGGWWETGAHGKQLELGESGMGRSFAALSLLFSAPGRWVGISHSSFPTSVADWRWGGLSWKQVLCQRRFSQVLGKLLGGWEKFLERKISCILTESKKHWPPVIYSWDGLEAK